MIVLCSEHVSKFLSIFLFKWCVWAAFFNCFLYLIFVIYFRCPLNLFKGPLNVLFQLPSRIHFQNSFSTLLLHVLSKFLYMSFQVSVWRSFQSSFLKFNIQITFQFHVQLGLSNVLLTYSSKPLYASFPDVLQFAFVVWFQYPVRLAFQIYFNPPSNVLFKVVFTVPLKLSFKPPLESSFSDLSF